MNKFQKIGVAMVFASGAASAALWNVDAPYGQVQWPWVIECQNRGGANPFDETDSNDPCYKDYGGWWFGYLAGWEPIGEVGPKVCINAPGMPEDGGAQSATNRVDAYLKDAATGVPGWVSFIGPDYPQCEGPAVTNKDNGSSLMSADGLELKLKIGDGYPGPDGKNWEPSIAGVAVALTMNPKQPKNVKAKNGFCLTYISDHVNDAGDNVGAEMQLELGWDEGIKVENKMVKGFDSWYAKIPESNGVKKIENFTWTGTPVTSCTSPPTPNEAGMFIQDNYTCWADNQKPANKPMYPGPFPIEKATEELVQVKIRLKGYKAQTVNFKLIEFGFAGECGGGTPIIAGGARPANPVSFEISGKTLSINSSVGKPLAVQIINLKGVVVQSKTMSQGDKMSLQSLPAGIYMVRVPALGYTVKQVVR